MVQFVIELMICDSVICRFSAVGKTHTKYNSPVKNIISPNESFTFKDTCKSVHYIFWLKMIQFYADKFHNIGCFPHF